MTSSDKKIVVALLTSVTAIMVAAIQATATTHQVNAVNSTLGDIGILGGTVDTKENMRFGDIPPGQTDLPANWKVWSRRVSFSHDTPPGMKQVKTFSHPPHVLVHLKSLDASNLRGSGPRLSISAPPNQVDRDGFVLNIYTWADEQGQLYAPTWMEVSWLAIAVPNSTPEHDSSGQ